MLLSLVELHDYQVHQVAGSWRENSLLSIPETLVELNCIACPQTMSLNCVASGTDSAALSKSKWALSLKKRLISCSSMERLLVGSLPRRPFYLSNE